jgi:predicted glycoside hydrolase/deacetylase ChbG (UPF0249 family)
MCDRFLIVNADDFGQSAGVNQGIITAYEHGILTSTSLMVRWPHASEAAAYGHLHPSLSIGLHLDFGEWAFRNDDWMQLYSVVDEHDAGAVEREIATQLASFRKLMGRDPTHIDSHQHVHRKEPARSILSAIVGELGIPVRDADPRVRYCGRFYGQCDDGTPWPEGIAVDALIELLSCLQPGTTELGCHPAAAVDLDTMYREERLQEFATLCDPRARKALDDLEIELCSFERLRSTAGGN